MALKGRWFGGVGYGQYPAVYRPHYSGPFPDDPIPDNQYLRWLIENGVLGLTSLVAFLGGIVAAGWRRIQTMADPIQADFYKALLAGWAGIATTFLFFDGFYWGASNMTFWSFLGLFATCLKPQS
jgi:O-antigen ligase